MCPAHRSTHQATASRVSDYSSQNDVDEFGSVSEELPCSVFQRDRKIFELRTFVWE